MADKVIGFFGAGQMARALAGGFVRAGLVGAERIVAHDPFAPAAREFAEALPKTRWVPNNHEVAGGAEVLFLAVKPQQVGTVAAELAGSLGPGHLLVSIVAGWSLGRLEAAFGTRRVIRVMPNTPCLVGRGAAGYAVGADATREDAEYLGGLLQAVGVAFLLEEKLLDAVTGLSGSGPAYVFTLIESLSDGGVRMGLPRAIATALAAQTVLGAAEMVLTTGEHPAVLKDRVASPGGTTIAGLQALERHGFRAALMGAVEAATERSLELG